MGGREGEKELGKRECGFGSKRLNFGKGKRAFCEPSKSSVIISASWVGCGRARRSVDPGLES